MNKYVYARVKNGTWNLNVLIV